MAVDRIYVGSVEEPLFYYDDDIIEAAGTAQAVALVGQELSVDTFTPIVRDETGDTLDVTLFLSSDGKAIRLANGQLYALSVEKSAEPSPIVNTPEGTPVWYYHEEELAYKGYIKSVKRVGRTKYQLNCVSAIGRLDRMQHGGGLFLTATVGDVLGNILTGSEAST